MIDDIAGYSFKDLVDAGILKSRTDLVRKQRLTGFPLPVKLGKRQAWFPRQEVQDWLNKRIAERVVAALDPPTDNEVKPVERRAAAGAPR